MKTVFLSLVLLVSTSAIAMDNQPPQQEQAPVVRTNEEIIRLFNGASFMRDFLNDGKKLEEDKVVVPAQDNAQQN